MSARVYSLLLSFYPAELRREFGAEMTEVFLEDLEDARRREGAAGGTRVWWRSVQELFRIAAPEQAARREVVVICMMWLLEICYFGAILLAHPDSCNDLQWTLQGLLGMILGGGMFPASVVLIALRVGDRSIPVPLKLGSQ